MQFHTEYLDNKDLDYFKEVEQAATLAAAEYDEFISNCFAKHGFKLDRNNLEQYIGIIKMETIEPALIENGAFVEIQRFYVHGKYIFSVKKINPLGTFDIYFEEFTETV